MWTDDQVAELVELAHEAGQLYERERLAAAQVELDACWRPAGRRRGEQLLAERLALFEECAARLAVELCEEYGRAPWRYEGGPVDWTTGLPLRAMEVAA
jgi:hypothetical protein